MVVITGATGQTGSKIASKLLDKGVKIRVVGRSAEKLEVFQKRGAEISIGDQGDASFFTNALRNADAVYLLIPPKPDASDVLSYYNLLGESAIAAIRNSGIKKVVFLSSLGAELASGTGPVLGLHFVEEKLKKLAGIDLALLRPGFFMENIIWSVGLIKHQHIFGNSASPDTPFSLIATQDIAEKASNLLEKLSFSGFSIVDLFGDLLSYNQVTQHLGKVIGNPSLPYVQFQEADALKSMMGMGLSESVAKSYIDLSLALGKGIIHATQTDPHKPNTATSFAKFAKEVFLPVFQNAA